MSTVYCITVPKLCHDVAREWSRLTLIRIIPLSTCPLPINPALKLNKIVTFKVNNRFTCFSLTVDLFFFYTIRNIASNLCFFNFIIHGKHYWQL